MGKAMMVHHTISGLFAIITLAICLIFVGHIVLTLWKNRNAFHLLRKQHSTLVHSLPMSLGMISTMTVCTITGALLTQHLSFAYILGFFIGMIVSGLISFPLYDIAVVDGVVAGAMGGLMGTMLGAMVPQVGLYTIILLLIIVFIFSWMTMRRRIQKIEPLKENIVSEKQPDRTETGTEVE